MLTLGEWFSRYGQRPLACVAVLVTATSLLYFGVSYREKCDSQDLAFKQLTESVGLALSQKNRSLLESLLQSTHWQMGVYSASLMNGENTLLSTQSPATRSLSSRTLLLDVPGFSGFKIRLVLPSIIGQRDFLFLISIALFSFIACSLVLLRVRHRFIQDILVPVQNGMDSDSRLGIAELDELQKRKKEAAKLRMENAVANAIVERNSQIAHDIRSPLSSLSLIADAAERLSENERRVFRSAFNRINEITSKLMDAETSQASTVFDSANKEQQPHPIALLVDSIVMDKRVEYRSKLRVDIINDLGPGYGLFCKAEPAELKRALSNLLNNAVEALPSEVGTVTVRVRRHGPNAIITISDNGKGIPREELAQLGEKGVSFGKASGSGLGLYHAKKSVESWGGKLNILSSVGNGTDVIIELPCVEALPWLPSAIVTSQSALIVVLDDDASIHQVWNHRFSHYPSLEILHLFNAKEFLELLGSGIENDEAVFLVDYELIGESYNGLELLTKLARPERATLITSHYDDETVLSTCQQMKVKVLPKAWAPYVPIRISPSL